MSHGMLREILPKYIRGEIHPYPQDTSIKPTYTRKLDKSDSILDWGKPAGVLEREIRAFKNWPRSRAQILGVNVIVTKAHTEEKNGPAGQVWIEKKQLGIFTLE